MTTPIKDKETGTEITLGELLEAPATVDCTIRYICAVRKALHECEVLSNDEADLELDINRLFHRIGRARRDKAFETSTARHKDAVVETQQKVLMPAPERLLAVVKPEVKRAPQFNNMRSKAVVTEVLEDLKVKEQSTVTFTELKSLVKVKHLEGGLAFAEGDVTKAPSNGDPKWVMTLKNRIRVLRDQDVLSYRKTKGDYFIY